jgi:hypothetical protein
MTCALSKEKETVAKKQERREEKWTRGQRREPVVTRTVL